MKITKDFSLEEFTDSDYATRNRIDNTPSPEVLVNLKNLLIPGMQRVRNVLNKPVFISSGYRCFVLNCAVKGARDSQHLLGLAADFKSPAYGTPKDIALFLASKLSEIKFDQLIYEGTWVHISFSSTPRAEIFTAKFLSSGTTYTKGII